MGGFMMHVSGKKISFIRLLAVLSGVVLAVGCFFCFEKAAVPTQVQPEEGTAIPVIMYHNVLPDGMGTLGDYVISASELEGDLKYLQEAGYTGITPRQLWNFTRGVGEIPEKPVLLTFDDGFESMLQVVLPLLEKYEFRATAAIVGRYTELYSGSVPRELTYSHLSWEQAKALQDSGLVEIANHSYDLHELEGSRKGMKKKSGESSEDYRTALADDLLLMQEKCRDHLGTEPILLVYPYGFYNAESESLAKEFGFVMTLTCEEGVSRISGPESLFAMKRYNRPHGADRETFFEKLGIS